MQRKIELDKYYEEGLKYLKEGNIIQASEKFYKCAEDAIKILSEKLEIPEYKKAKEKGKWSTVLLFEAVRRICDVLKNPEIRHLWAEAWFIHTEGFHEERLKKEEIEARLEDIKKLIKIARNAKRD